MTPSAAITESLASADQSRIVDGTGVGVVTCGGGPYQYGIYVLVKMLRLCGYAGGVWVWHRGPAEPVCSAIRKMPGVTVVDVVKDAEDNGLRAPAGGWECKAYAMARTPVKVAAFFDADAYPVNSIDACLETAEAEGEVFWRDLDNANLQWRSLGLEVPKPKWIPVNGGQWVVNRELRKPQLALYSALTDRSSVLYRYMLGDQDCQLLAWYLTNTRYFIGDLEEVRQVRGVRVYDFPHGRTQVLHRIGSKMAPSGMFSRGTYSGPVRGLPLERQATSFYAEAVDAVGVPIRAK